MTTQRIETTEDLDRFAETSSGRILTLEKSLEAARAQLKLHEDHIKAARQWSQAGPGRIIGETSFARWGDAVKAMVSGRED